MDSSPEPQMERVFGLERLIFFSDAVFAIAITLLAIELRVPEIVETANDAIASQTLWLAIAAEWPRLLAFALSFYIIGAFWIAHHRYFRYIKSYDEGLIRLNLVWLFFVVLLSFTTAILGEYGNLQIAIVLYALNLICAGLAGEALWYHATHARRLVDAALDERFIRRLQARTLTMLLASLIVIGLTFFIDDYASFGWLLIFVFQGLVERHYRRTGTFK
ncbi:MAG: DUF1211 domain-containing protein [Chloroflexi bacterium]|nr:MAG: DUF1211 domain-containing protein [Chloroflexota bacterium]